MAGKKTPLEKAKATLGALTPDDLRALAGDIADLLAIHEEGANADLAAPDPAGANDGEAEVGRRGGAGYIETKFIPRKRKDGTVKLYGPYLYMRQWKTGKGKKILTSKYLGKGG